MRDPRNTHDRNAVMVVVRGQHLGYIPAELAKVWSPYLTRMEADGYRVRAEVEVWGRTARTTALRCSARLARGYGLGRSHSRRLSGTR